MTTRDENFNKDILLGNKDILYLKTVFQYSSRYGIMKQKGVKHGSKRN